MEQDIKRIVQRQFPELTGGYHLPLIGRVEAISDPLEQPALGEDFRPRFAVDLVLLTPQGEPDPDLPLYRAVPLPVGCAGLERGQFGFPEPGTLVEVAFAWGLPHKPFIRTLLPHGLSLPDLQPGELVHQAGPEVIQRADSAGHWARSTHGNITDQCTRHFLNAVSSLATLQEQHEQVAAHSTEEVGGIKLIEALGALKLLSGGALNLSAVDNLNHTTASDINATAARDLKERVGNISDRLAVVSQRVKVKDGGKMWLGSESVNVLQILSDLIQVVQDIATTAASHTHPNVGTPNQAGDFNDQSGTAGNLKGQLDPVVE